MDPLISKKILGGQKLIKWRIFIFCDKFIDFDHNLILDKIN